MMQPPITWLDVADAPNWDGAWPDRDAPRCHDGSGYLEVVCPCGYQMHMHRTQLDGLPTRDAIVTPCQMCDRLLGLAVADVVAAIDRMWDRQLRPMDR